jgi:murein DD-endopeptidase MepM/ murein hydrolase activator NlpD
MFFIFIAVCVVLKKGEPMKIPSLMGGTAAFLIGPSLLILSCRKANFSIEPQETIAEVESLKRENETGLLAALVAKIKPFPGPTRSALSGFCVPLGLPNEEIREYRHWGTGSHKSARGYYGTDFSHAQKGNLPIGTPLTAMRSAKVIRYLDSFPDKPANQTSQGMGSFNYIEMESEAGVRFTYFHIQQNSVRNLGIIPGKTLVKAGQIVAKSGHNGFSTGPHLHVEVLAPGTSGLQWLTQSYPFVVDWNNKACLQPLSLTSVPPEHAPGGSGVTVVATVPWERAKLSFVDGVRSKLPRCQMQNISADTPFSKPGFKQFTFGVAHSTRGVVLVSAAYSNSLDIASQVEFFIKSSKGMVGHCQ